MCSCARYQLWESWIDELIKDETSSCPAVSDTEIKIGFS